MLFLFATGGTGVLSYELRRQYPEMEVTVFEMDHVVQLVQEKFVPGNEHLNVKFVSGASDVQPPVS